LADHYVNVTGYHVRPSQHEDGLVNVPASRFLRPCVPPLAPLDSLRLSRITSAMEAAAQSGAVYHLWWHPHNFGLNIEKNIAFLDAILTHYAMLHDRYGMKSANMGDFA